VALAHSVVLGNGGSKGWLAENEANRKKKKVWGNSGTDPTVVRMGEKELGRGGGDGAGSE